MLGHTGNFEATLKAVKIIDEVIGKIMKAVLAVDGVMIITSDHGNADQMINIFTGEVYTEHTTNPVPFYLVMNALKRERRLPEIMASQKNIAGILPDVATTVLDLLRIPAPADLDGQSLLPILYKQTP
jgi:2,3-bisphosphoglycerate-independent phosphoglycerate mutase